MSGPSRKTYFLTYVGLLGLLLVNTLIAFVNLGWFSTVIAIGLATIMACLVAGILMHGFYEAKIVQIIIAGGVIFFLIMMSLTMNDYFTRGWLPFHTP
ncbi:MAG: oxidase [Acidobacteriaceae bacterium]|nr:oxidase [Acidobacteriaceae bacterium]